MDLFDQFTELPNKLEQNFDDWNEGLMTACKNGNEQLVCLMIERGAYKLDYGFITACEYGQIKVALLLLERGIDQLTYNSAFIQACRNNRLKMISLMLQMKTELTCPLADGLSVVAELGFVKVVKLFLEQKLADEVLCIGLKSACRGGFIDIVHLILNHSKLTITDDILVSACRGGQMEIIRLIMSLNKSRTFFYTWNEAMIRACRGGHMEVVLLAIERGARGNDVWNNGLLNACLGGHMAIVQLMISLGGKTNFYWDIGLLNACQFNHMEIVQLMIEHGASVSSEAIYTACFNGNEELTRLLIDRNTGNTDWDGCLIGACMSANLKLVQLIIDQGAIDFDNALYTACLYGHAHLVKFLLRPKLNVATFNGGLEGACEGGYYDLALLMLQRGANNLDSALIKACKEGHLNIARLLLQHGAKDLNLALRGVCQDSSNMHLAKMLIEAGATNFDVINERQIVQLLNLGLKLNDRRVEKYVGRFQATEQTIADTLTDYLYEKGLFKMINEYVGYA